MNSRKNSPPLFVLGLLGVLFFALPTSDPKEKSTEAETDASQELAALEKRATLAEAEVKRLNRKISSSVLNLLYKELDAVEFGGVEPSGPWENYYVVLVGELNRKHFNPKEVNKLLDRMVDMSKRGKYFFPGQADNLEAFYQDVERLRPK
ncbi:hypothetical protein A2356_03440 [Candidatus Nomurabacteria bacterium RIFOXYB1_FULL_39_16]|uniref:Uncharacterized protein n=2 Tax=Candidatus Nomuraibacteriota TaxID=1752729 RepID=A0A0G0TA18_9BACT|nr:MAG: hypothetical protein UT78_C0001G0106 [Candidatus Nomurabacteria bacterium GW2011_GWF2_40_12]OGJ08848.1 MAG: hypothetical protein A2356_03440 [Candidatus Nomurabacteria bacterium RIFOXYB1_FULL_39_16]OGJ14936.1 MAG: hypothetical protein A2585_03495 [Candidatus Nomurabacteria bacterium RIFOXYD1_FULL_39_12]